MVHDDGTVYILILNETLFFGKSMYHILVKPNHIRSFGIPVSNNPFDRTQEFGIDHKELFIPFKTKGETLLFDTYVTSDH